MGPCLCFLGSLVLSIDYRREHCQRFDFKRFVGIMPSRKKSWRIGSICIPIYRQLNPAKPNTISCRVEYDRDYYDELKQEYADRDNVQIFSKDDYEIDETLTPWLDQDLDTKVKKIQNVLVDRQKDDQDLTEVSRPSLRLSDIHTAEAIEEFEPLMRECDAVSGREWDDPMPESDFERETDWIHFRKMDESDLDDDGEEFFAGLEEKPLRRKLYNSLEEELEAVQESVHRMQMENLDQEIPVTAWGENLPSPDPKDLEKWRRAAEERGGNVVQKESFFLSPVTARQPVAADSLQEFTTKSRNGTSEVRKAPRQHRELVLAHEGKWQGQVFVFSLQSSKDVSLQPVRELNLQSEISVSPGDESLVWTSIVEGDSAEFVSDCKLRHPKYKDSLMSGRAVCTDGNYIMSSSPAEHLKPDSETGELTVGSRFLRKVTNDPAVTGAVEMCILSTESAGQVLRDRVMLCIGSASKQSGAKSGKESPSFRYIVLLTENRESPLYSYSSQSSASLKLQRNGAPVFARITGTWMGSGELLHPEFPVVPYRKVDTKYSFLAAKDISEKDVSWVETIPNDPEATSKGRERTIRKKKVSKRVSAARDHDKKRLEQCSYLSCETVGSEADAEKYAWRESSSSEGRFGMFSPRIGRFVDDYGSVILNDRLLLSFPASKAFPNILNTVCLTQVNTPRRQRISVCRNENGEVVGGLFVNEIMQEGSDEAA